MVQSEDLHKAILMDRWTKEKYRIHIRYEILRKCAILLYIRRSVDQILFRQLMSWSSQRLKFLNIIAPSFSGFICQWMILSPHGHLHDVDSSCLDAFRCPKCNARTSFSMCSYGSRSVSTTPWTRKHVSAEIQSFSMPFIPFTHLAIFHLRTDKLFRVATCSLWLLSRRECCVGVVWSEMRFSTAASTRIRYLSNFSHSWERCNYLLDIETRWVATNFKSIEHIFNGRSRST